MTKLTVDPGEALASLSDLSIYELRNEWRRHYRTLTPMRLSRDLLMRGVSYKLQERAHGGLSKAVLRKLERAVGEPSADSAPPPLPVILKPGTRLVREWHGVTHTVVVLEDGVEWRGRRYGSLSEVARAITGARWSGPRFFGFRRRSDEARKGTGESHAEA